MLMDVCRLKCGNGVRNSLEECDDGNAQSLDGCDASCKVELGWACSGGSFYTADKC